MVMMEILSRILEREEGYREFPYLDSRGLLTVGIGTLMSTMTGHDPADYRTFRMSRVAARTMLNHEVSDLFLKLCKFPVFVELSPERQIILLSMGYQMGYNGLMKFKNMWAALEGGLYMDAEEEALDSNWHDQTPARARRHARIIGGQSIKFVYGEL